MGASDDYIARQLQRHTLILAFQGAFAGMIVGTVLLGLIGWLSGEMGVTLLPDFTLSTFQKTLLACLPIILALLAMGTARTTVLRDLAKMP